MRASSTGVIVGSNTTTPGACGFQTNRPWNDVGGSWPEPAAAPTKMWIVSAPIEFGDTARSNVNSSAASRGSWENGGIDVGDAIAIVPRPVCNSANARWKSETGAALY